MVIEEPERHQSISDLINLSPARSERADSADNGERKNWGFRHACDERGVTKLKIVVEALAAVVAHFYLEISRMNDEI